MTSGAPGPWWTAVAGAIFGLSALVVAPLIGLEISSEFANSGGHATWLTLFAGVFLMGTLFWWLLVSRAQRFSPVRGAVTGIFVAFFSYPVVVTLSEIVYRDWHAPPPFAARPYGRLPGVWQAPERQGASHNAPVVGTPAGRGAVVLVWRGGRTEGQLKAPEPTLAEVVPLCRSRSLRLPRQRRLIAGEAPRSVGG